MPDSDVQVIAKLTLDRDSWANDLQTARGQFAEFAQQLATAKLNIPLAVDLSSANAQMMAWRMEQESRPLRIPVEMVPAGAGVGGGWGGRFSSLMAGTGGDDFGGTRFGGRFGGGGFGPAGDTFNYTYNTMGMPAVAEELNPNRYVPSYSDIESAAEGPVAEEGAALGAAGGGRRRGGRGGGMRGMRLFMAAHLAIRGVEAAYGSWEYNHPAPDDPMGSDPDANAKAEIERINHMREGFGGITGMGRDLGKWSLDHPWVGSGLQLFGYTSADFDDQGSIQKIQDSIKADKGQEQEARYQRHANELDRGLNRRLSDAQDTLNIARMPDGIQKNLAEIHKRTKEMAEGFDQEAHLLEEAAGKLKGTDPARQKLLDAAAAARARGSGIAGDVDAFESGAARHRDFIDRTNRQELLNAHIGSLAGENEALADRLRGDTYGASRATIEASRSEAQAQLRASYRAANGRMSLTDYEREREQIDRRAGLQLQGATQSEDLRATRTDDMVAELKNISAYTRRMAEIQNRAKEQSISDPAHADQYQQIANAEVANLNRQHDQSIRRMRNEADVLDMRTAGHRWEANNLELANQENEELEANKGDPAMQGAIRRKYQSMRDAQNVPRFSDTSMRSIYDDVLKAALGSGSQPNRKANPGGGIPPPNDPGAPDNPYDPWSGYPIHGSGGGGDAWNSTAQKLSAAADKISNAPSVMTAA